MQRIIDRIIFLRICEDRGIEHVGQLRALLNSDQVYPRLLKLFRDADDRYNSGLFYFRPEKGRDEQVDELTPALDVDDATLKGIIRRLYYPESPYEFTVVSADILGSVYERFLGSVITLTAGHRAKIEEKPEVRKAGGVYYTPTYIVDYIVQHTVGKLLEGRTPKEAAKLKVLDPACGSGSFLIGAYQHLLDWHLNWYVADGPQNWSTGKNPRLRPGPAGDWRLTIKERKRILLDNIHGVDIDYQAVEVTKLSLLLKVLEGETAESLGGLYRLFHERALPDLGHNIQCGNSLIGTDIVTTEAWDRSTAGERQRINPFDFPAAFPHVFKRGGFDAVIGNPPYIRIQNLREFAPHEVELLKNTYSSASEGNYDIYVTFIERAIGLIVRSGLIGFIVPNKFLTAKYGRPLRDRLSRDRNVKHLVHFGDEQVFEHATTYTCLLFLSGGSQKSFEFVRVRDLEAWLAGSPVESSFIAADRVTSAEWNLTAGSSTALFEKIAGRGTRLGRLAHIFVGLQTSADTVFLFKDAALEHSDIVEVQSKELGRAVQIERDLLKPVIRSGHIGRYWADPTAMVLFPYQTVSGRSELIPEQDMRSKYPLAWRYLSANRKLLESREHGRFADSGRYQLYPKNLDGWEEPKLMIPYMTTRLSTYLDNGGYYFVNVTTGGFALRPTLPEIDLRFLTGLLNSRLLDWFFKSVSANLHSGYFGANKQFLVQLPIVLPEHNAAVKCNEIVAVTDALLLLHTRRRETAVPHDIERINREIGALDHKVDCLVYRLYDLDDEDIRVIESNYQASD